MKLLVCDVEGTIFKAKYKIDGTDYASTMWQPLAHCLGDDAIDEELATHQKWEGKEYDNYMDWVDATCEIHKKHKLTKKQFDGLIRSAEYMPGVEDFFRTLDRNKYIPVLVSGGFDELIHRAQHELNIKHGTAACKYNFNDGSGLLESWSVKPSDFEGKFDYVRNLFKAFKLNRLTDWIFIGDGKNDVDIAKRAPLSFGINAHADLAREVTYNVNDFVDIRHLMDKNEHIDFLSQDAILSAAEVAKIERNEAVIRERDALAKEIDKINAELEMQASAMKILYENLAKSHEAVDAERAKRKKLEASRAKLKESSEKMKKQQDEYEEQIKDLTITLGKASEIARADIANELQGLKNKVFNLDSQLQETLNEVHRKDILLQESATEIVEQEKRIVALRDRETGDEEANQEHFANRFEQQIYLILKATRYNSTFDWEVVPNFESSPGQLNKGVVDCLVVTDHCIVVIEAKNYRGEIISDGDLENNPWYCHSGGSKRLIKCNHKNPYHQLKGYCDNVRNLVEKRLRQRIQVFGVVVFPTTPGIETVGCAIGKYYRVATSDSMISSIRILVEESKKHGTQNSLTSPEKLLHLLLGRSIQ